MARMCDVCGKKPQVGHQISHAHNVSLRRFSPNLFKIRAKVDGRPRRLTVCTRCLRTNGIKAWRSDQLVQAN